MLRECVVLVTVCVFCVGSFSGRGFFCRDPDTGTLHGPNSTWPASSFCGKYHCKVKRKNVTGTEYAPYREINITNIKGLGENVTNTSDIQTENKFVKKDDVVKVVVSTDKKTEPDIKQNGNTLQETQGVKIEEDIDDNHIPDQDRYLSEKEIRSLTDILHTVKKADLDAIVEIYNLAQDIYKEIDKTSTDHVLEEVLSTAKTLNQQAVTSDQFNKVTKHDRVSYWIKHDINSEMPEIVNGVEIPAVDIINVPSKPTTRTIQSPPSYFNGPLTRKDFGKLPYFYPVSNFQRLSSYQHEPEKILPTTAITPPTAPKSTHKTVPYTTIYADLKYQKELRPSVYLPYPFTNIQRYNWSFPSHMYYTDLFAKVKTRKKDDYQSIIINNKFKNHDNAILINPYLENFQDLEIKESMKEENIVPPKKIKSVGRYERRKPDWQTDSLPTQLLEEVRAHVQEKQRLFFNPIPIRKRVKLEKVANVLHMERFVRAKRSEEVTTSAPKEEELPIELFEVYIETLTCEADYSVPGYFQYGNLSEPFPACCPQRIPLV